MNQKIASALISVFYKDGLEPVVRRLAADGVTLYSTGGTQAFIEALGLPVTPVESLTTYPSILGGRVKTLHPSVFGGILGRRGHETDMKEMEAYRIPQIDLVIVDLYPFEETVRQTEEEALIIEKIDIGGPSMIRAAAKNFSSVAVVASRDEYAPLVQMLEEGGGALSLEQRRALAARAFRIVARYDEAIEQYFDATTPVTEAATGSLRYGENPHQPALFEGDLSEVFNQLHGKELSYNNLVDVDAAVELIREFEAATFAVIKHTNVCGIASRDSIEDAWSAALAGDPESAFGGVLVTNREVNAATARAISEIFFEVLLAPSFSEEALTILKGKKNRILLQLVGFPQIGQTRKSVLNGTLVQEKDAGNWEKWEETGARETTEAERSDLEFANLVCKHLKSNAIALVRDRQLIGKGCGQTSRIDALRHALEKARQSGFSTEGSVMASDAFFPFDDCVRMGAEGGITAFIQPGGSIRDKDSIEYCKGAGLAMVLTGRRHFRH